jgi:hypothetical protein
LHENIALPENNAIAGAFPSGAPYDNLPRTNTLAFLCSSFVNKEKSFIESPLDDWLMFVDGQYGTSVRITSLNLQKKREKNFSPLAGQNKLACFTLTSFSSLI